MMTFREKVSDQVANSANEVERRVQDVVERVDDAREALSGWADRARRVVRKNPGAAIAGAFALGFGLAMLARRRDP